MKEPTNFQDILEELEKEIKIIEIECRAEQVMLTKLLKYKLWIENIINESRK